MKKWLLSLAFLVIAISYVTLPSGNPIKIGKYVISLHYTRFTQTNWWTRIEPYNIYLGAIPLASEGHTAKIIALGVDAILSVLEDFELQKWPLTVPVSHATWREAGLRVDHIKAVDFSPLTTEEIKAGIAVIDREYENGQTIYVHCKAGRGRSAAIVVAFLMEKEQISLDDAISRVKAQRPEINLNSYQVQALIDYTTQ